MDKAPDQADSSPPAEAHTLTVEQIRRALISDNGDVRERFRREFPSEIEVLAHELHRTYGRLRQFTKSVSVDKRAAWVEMFLLAAFNSVLTSAHLLLSGFLIPAGNLMRQFGEACAIAMLASHRKIKMLERLESDSSKVWAGKSVREVEQAENQELLGIDPDGWARFAKITHWYNRYSHASALVLASLNLFDRPNTLVVGAAFDGGKIDAYRKELRLRSSAAECLRDGDYIQGLPSTFPPPIAPLRTFFNFFSIASAADISASSAANFDTTSPSSNG